MKKVYFIYQLYQTGNIGPHNTERVKEQPEDGFKTYKGAEKYIENCMLNKNKWLFQQKEYVFTILPTYQQNNG